MSARDELLERYVLGARDALAATSVTEATDAAKALYEVALEAGDERPALRRAATLDGDEAMGLAGRLAQ